MSGRGGKGTSLTHEQLQALGCIGKDMPAVSTVPPTFPPLLTTPVKREITAAQDYKILWKEAFVNFMRDSPYFTVPKTKKREIQSYSDQIQNAIENTKDKLKAEIPWRLMPAELAPSWKKRKLTDPNAIDRKKKARAKNIVSHLKTMEDNDKSGDEGDPKNESEEEIEPQEDEEMDDENDYGENYFDNGEAYNEEDDNLDDGPVY